MPENIYLDHAATTPVRPEVRAAMEPYIFDCFANPSSVYRLAQTARAALDRARDSLAGLLKTYPAELVFTAGGTESNNAAIKGSAWSRQTAGRHIVTTSIEHHAVLHPIQELTERFGFEATVIPIGPAGLVDPIDVERALRPDTVLVSVMWANNEIGTIQPIQEVGEIVRRHGATFHVDAVQASAYLPIDLAVSSIDLLSLSAHKFNGPKGAGLLFIRRGTSWWPLLTGGGQERNRRAGTENVAGIVGMARAFELTVAERPLVVARVTRMRDHLLTEILHRIDGARLNGDRHRRMPNNLNFCFHGVHGESLLVGLDLAGIMASSGSACTSGTLEPSHVLLALGLAPDTAQSSLRLSLGPENTDDEMDRTVATLEKVIGRLRALAPTSVGRA